MGFSFYESTLHFFLLFPASNPTMNLSDAFDSFVANRKLVAAVGTRQRADTLRVSLTRKFKDYREQMGALGFLAADLEDASVCMEWDKGEGIASFFLRPRKRTVVDYMILVPEDNSGEHEQK